MTDDVVLYIVVINCLQLVWVDIWQCS